MNARANYFKIGLFVTSAVTIVVIAVIALGAGVLFRKKFMMETYIKESVQGLDVGSSVKFRGVQIGNVEEISIVGRVYGNSSRYVLVRVSLYPDVFRFPTQEAITQTLQENIEEGLRVRLASQGVTGTAYIEADFLDPQRYPPLVIDWEPRYPYVPSAPSTITRLLDSVEDFFITMERINIEGISESLEKSLRLVAEVAEKANVEKISVQVEQFFTEIRETNKRISRLVDEANIQPIISDISAAVAGARRMVEGAEEPVARIMADLPETSTRIKKLTGNLDSVIDDLPEIMSLLTRTLRRLDHLVASRQRDVEVTIENFREISSNLKELSENAKRYPAQLLFGEPPKPVNSGNSR